MLNPENLIPENPKENKGKKEDQEESRVYPGHAPGIDLESGEYEDPNRKRKPPPDELDVS